MSQPGSNNPNGSQFPGQFNPLQMPPGMMYPAMPIPPAGMVFPQPMPFVRPMAVAPVAQETNKAATAGKVVGDWIEYIDANTKRPYYYNQVTESTQWTKPPEFVEASSNKSGDGDWIEYMDANTNRPYYYNAVTGSTVWQKPPSMSSKANSPPRTTTTVIETPSEIPRSTSPVLSKAESVQIFKQLLTDSGVDVDWDWNRTMKKIIRDDRYKVLKSMKQKTDVFNEYVYEKREAERDVRKEREKKSRSDFLQMLSEMTELTSRSNYHTIIPKLEHDSRYQAVREADRIRIYEEYLSTLEKKEKEQRIQKMAQAGKEFRELLQAKMDDKVFNIDSQYRKCIDKIHDEPSFKILDEYERVRIWKDFFADVNRKHEEQRAQERLQRKKQEKENRADLWDLFLSLQKESKMDVLSSWKEIKPIIQNQDGFKRVESNTSGPNAKELFQEFLVELEKRYKRDKRLFKTMLKENKEQLSVHIDSVYADWIQLMKQDPRTSEMDADNVKILFEENVDKARQRAKKKKKNLERFNKMLDEILSHVDIHHVSYDNVLPQMQSRSCYEKIKTDEERRSLFDEHVKYLIAQSSEKKRKLDSNDVDANDAEVPDAKRIKVDQEVVPPPTKEAPVVTADAVTSEQNENATSL